MVTSTHHSRRVWPLACTTGVTQLVRASPTQPQQLGRPQAARAQARSVLTSCAVATAAALRQACWRDATRSHAQSCPRSQRTPCWLASCPIRWTALSWSPNVARFLHLQGGPCWHGCCAIVHLLAHRYRYDAAAAAKASVFSLGMLAAMRFACAVPHSRIRPCTGTGTSSCDGAANQLLITYCCKRARY